MHLLPAHLEAKNGYNYRLGTSERQVQVVTAAGLHSVYDTYFTPVTKIFCLLLAVVYCVQCWWRLCSFLPSFLRYVKKFVAIIMVTRCFVPGMILDLRTAAVV